MSVLGRLRRLRVLLVSLLVTRALLLGVSAALVVIIVAMLMDVVVGIPAETRRFLTMFALLTGITIVVVLTLRARNALELERVALWVEERVPTLQYALVTAASQTSASAAESSQVATEVGWNALSQRAAWTALAMPVMVLAAALSVLALMPDVMVARVRAPQPGDALDRVALPGNRLDHLSPIVATVTPPPYSGEAQRVTEDPISIAGLVGSRVSVRGPWSREATVTALLGDTARRVVASSSRWTLEFAMPPRAIVLRLREAGKERIVTVEPRPDRVPVVTLTTPVRDSVLREASGTLGISADVSDDIGIATAAFELIVSSGEGESFTFKSRLIGAVTPQGGTRALSMRDSVMLGTLGLKPGDIIHLRAIARDANNVTGPGQGASETRTLRIARASEYDSVAVEGAPPLNPEDGVLSQRMLIMLAEALEKRRPKLNRSVVLSESQVIARDQKKLRKRVGEIIFERLGDESHSHDEEEGPEGEMTPEQLLAAADSATNPTGTLDFAEGESPVVAINKPLLEAYNHMWEATRELDAGEPGRALPPMRAALAAIQRARNAERIYLRGRPPQVIVDLAKVRLQGKEKGNASARTPRSPSADPERQLARRLANVLANVEAMEASLVDSLMILRVEALTDAPLFARALAEAVEVLRKGGDATMALVRARRTLEPVEGADVGNALWSGW